MTNTLSAESWYIENNWETSEEGNIYTTDTMIIQCCLMRIAGNLYQLHQSCCSKPSKW